jgi:hypothetical protein
LNVLDLIADGCTVVEATAAIGGAPKSKIIFAWLKDSEEAGEFDPPPSESDPWCIVWRDKLEFFHLHYRDAVIDGKEIRKHRRSPLRAELEQRLAAKRAPAPAQLREPVGIDPAMKVDHVAQAPVVILDTPKPERPAYAYRRPPRINVEDKPQGPPEEGRFSVSRHVVSRTEARAGTIELTDQGIRKW